MGLKVQISLVDPLHCQATDESLGRFARLQGTGQVRAFQWNSTGGKWDLLGQVLTDESLDDEFGRSVSLSRDGLTMAAGAPLRNSNDVDAGELEFTNILQY